MPNFLAVNVSPKWFMAVALALIVGCTVTPAETDQSVTDQSLGGPVGSEATLSAAVESTVAARADAALATDRLKEAGFSAQDYQVLTGAPYPEGLWGVEVGGDLVAVLSDLQLLSTWEVDASLRPGEEGPIKSPYLQAGINIVLYALTREGGLTAKRERPLWAAATGVTRLVSRAQPF